MLAPCPTLLLYPGLVTKPIQARSIWKSQEDLEDYGQRTEGEQVAYYSSWGGGGGGVAWDWGLWQNLVKAFCATGYYEDSKVNHFIHGSQSNLQAKTLGQNQKYTEMTLTEK